MEANVKEQTNLKSAAIQQSSNNRGVTSSSQPLNDLSGDCGSETKRKQTPSDENIKHSNKEKRDELRSRKSTSKGKTKVEKHDQSGQKVEDTDNDSLTKEELQEHIMHLKEQVRVD